MVKAVSFKNWCIENITPQSWPRIVLKSIPEIREKGFDSNGLQDPPEDLMIPEDVMAILNKWLHELYDIKVEEEMLI